MPVVSNYSASTSSCIVILDAAFLINLASIRLQSCIALLIVPPLPLAASLPQPSFWALSSVNDLVCTRIFHPVTLFFPLMHSEVICGHAAAMVLSVLTIWPPPGAVHLTRRKAAGVSGFRARQATATGRKILKLRRKKGRHVLCKISMQSSAGKK